MFRRPMCNFSSISSSTSVILSVLCDIMLYSQKRREGTMRHSHSTIFFPQHSSRLESISQCVNKKKKKKHNQPQKSYLQLQMSGREYISPVIFLNRQEVKTFVLLPHSTKSLGPCQKCVLVQNFDLHIWLCWHDFSLLCVQLVCCVSSENTCQELGY